MSDWKTTRDFIYAHWVDEDNMSACGAHFGAQDWRNPWSDSQRCPVCVKQLAKKEAEAPSSFAVVVLQRKRDQIADSLRVRRNTIERLDTEMREAKARLDGAIEHKDKMVTQLEEIEHALNLLGGV